MDPSKALITDTFEQFFFINQKYFLYLLEAILANIQNICLPKAYCGTVMEKIPDPLIFCADQTELITNFAVITSAGIKRVHCI